MRTTVVVLLLLAGGAVDALAQLRTRVHASGFTQPIAFVQDPTDPAVQFVVQQRGRIRVVRNGTVERADFLDLTAVVRSGGEQGLLGLAFPPTPADAAASTSTSRTPTATPSSRVSGARRIRSSPTRRRDSTCAGTAPPARPDPAAVREPQRRPPRVRPGRLSLYRPWRRRVGKRSRPPGAESRGAARQDSARRCQRAGHPPDRLSGAGRTIPSSAAPLRPEIWSFGWRNPWRYSFDDPSRGGTGALVAGDVGQNAWEESQLRAAAAAAGATTAGATAKARMTTSLRCPPAFLPLVDPIHEYDHTAGSSITGGYVYRGTALAAEYRGRYFFADFIRSRVWSIALTVDAQRPGARQRRARAHRGFRRHHAALECRILRRRRRRRALHRQLRPRRDPEDHRSAADAGDVA